MGIDKLVIKPERPSDLLDLVKVLGKHLLVRSTDGARIDTQSGLALQPLKRRNLAQIKRPLPLEVLERAKIHIVDTFAAMISGSRLLPGKRAIDYVKALGGRPEAGIMGTRLVTLEGFEAIAYPTDRAAYGRLCRLLSRLARTSC
jgi:hypothetical protein